MLSGQVATALAALIGIRLLTEYVPPQVYGSVTLMIGIATLGQNLFCTPLLQAAYRFYPDTARTENVSGLRYIITGYLKKTSLGLSAAIALGGALYCFISGESFWGICALIGYLVITVAQTLELNLLGAARRQRFVALWEAADAWCKPLLAIIAVTILGATTQSVLAGYVIATSGVYLVIRLLPLQLEGCAEPPKNPTDNTLRKGIMQYAVPLMPLAFVGWVSSLSDRYIIGGLLGLEQVGIYAAAYGLISRPFLMAAGIVSRTLRPVYNESVSENDSHRERRIFRAWLGISLAVNACGVVGILVLKKWIAFFLLAEPYRQSAMLMPWFAAGFSLQALSFVFENYLYTHKHTRGVLLGQTIGAVSSLAAAIPMILAFGLHGAAYACPIYFLFLCIAMLGIKIYYSRLPHRH